MTLKDKEKIIVIGVNWVGHKVYQSHAVEKAVLELEQAIDNIKGDLLSKETTKLMIKNILGDFNR